MKRTDVIDTHGRHDGDQLIHPITSDNTEPDEPHQPSLMSLLPSTPTPIDSLAPELLKLIFEEACADNATGDSFIKKAHPKQKSALDTGIKLSHVCRFWREVALTTPSLWATIDRFHNEFENFVRRSKSLPVRLYVEAEKDDDSTASTEIDFPKWLQRYSGRVREIFAEGSTETVQNLLYTVGTSLPELVSLDLRALGQDLATLQTFTPNLRHLFLYRVSANLDSYADLTHLTLEGLHSGSGVPKAADLVSLLRNSPRLSVLCLYGLDLDMVDDGVGGTSDVVELAQLQILDFQQLAMNTIVYLISRIRIPPCAPLVRNCHNCPFSDQELWLEISAQRYVVLGASTHSPNGICTFRVELPYNSQSVFSDIKVPLSAVDTSTVVSLLFVAPSVLDAPPSVSVWFAFLARLPSLATITLWMPKAWIENFIKALCHHEPEVPCAVLETLTIMDADIYDDVAYANLGQITWDYLHARAQSVGLLELLRLHCGHGDGLNWERVTKSFDSCVLTVTPSTSSTAPAIVG